jgi:hypothetical protein
MAANNATPDKNSGTAIEEFGDAGRAANFSFDVETKVSTALLFEAFSESRALGVGVSG